MKIFVDTSAFYALADEDDCSCCQAKETYETLITSGQLYTSDYILVECWFLTQNRLGRRAALEFWDGLSTGIATMIKVELQDLGQAREIIRGFSDQDVSLVDAISFAVMKREGIGMAFAFNPDPHIDFGRGTSDTSEVVPE